MKNFADHEIQIRKNSGLWNYLTYNQMKNITFYRCDITKLFYNGNYKNYCKFRSYLKNKNKNKCICGGNKWDAKVFDPDCPGKLYHNWNIQEKIHDENLVEDVQLDFLLNPKLKLISL